MGVFDCKIPSRMRTLLNKFYFRTHVDDNGGMMANCTAGSACSDLKLESCPRLQVNIFSSCLCLRRTVYKLRLIAPSVLNHSPSAHVNLPWGTEYPGYRFPYDTGSHYFGFKKFKSRTVLSRQKMAFCAAAQS